MKTRFTSIDIIAVVKEIHENVVGKRVVQVYDIDNKTFLIKLSRGGEDGKSVLLIESGIRIHITEFEWQKNIAPSGFSMKLRKHIKNRRLESIKQIGTDRIIDMQFGANECAFHIIAELYDRGNMVLTDHEYTIMHLIRPRVDNLNELKFQTKEQYPINKTDKLNFKSNKEHYIQLLHDNLEKCKHIDNLRKLCSSIFTYGPNLLEHCLQECGFTLNMKISQCLEDSNQSEFIDKIFSVFVASQDFIDSFKTLKTEGYIIGKSINNESEVYDEFHPYLYRQLQNKENIKHLATFNQAVDEYFSAIKSQKSEQQMQQKEKAAMKKLENIQLDRERRLKELKEAQENDLVKGELIQMNADIVNRAILILNRAAYNGMTWEYMEDLVKHGKEAQDPAATSIVNLDFEHSQMTVRLQDPYDENNEDFVDTTVDLTLNAYENARFYFTQKKQAKNKEDKTLDATDKAFKSATKKTNQMLKEVKVVSKINKIRKTNWFEKFNWFISSEKYLVIGGKDMQQNEFIVKRYFRPGDVYVHADIHGASTVIIKNHKYPAVPEISPKTLTEAGQMAVVYSSAWEHKIASSSWWVYYDQVSKTAPSGEYLTTGAFMIRGKKNYLPTEMLTYGFGIIFKVSEESVERRTEAAKLKPEILNEPSMNKSDQSSLYKEEEMQEMNMDQGDDEDDEDGEDESKFPDTTIEIKSEPLPIQIEEEEVDHQKSHKYKTAKQKRDEKKGHFKSSKQVSFDEEIQVKAEKDETTNKEADTNDDPENESNSDDENLPRKQEQEKGPQPLKRGQKSKLKKMKKKYKDQDEDEKKVKIAILQGRNPYEEGETLKHLTKKQKKKMEEEEKLQRKELRIKQQAERKQKQIQQFQQNQRQRHLSNDYNDNAESDDDEDHNQQHIGQLDVLPSLIGQPDPEDEIMYAMPMLAPYVALQNFKYKVKMIPGTTKRGRAAKNILFNLMNDKTAPEAEKNQIRALKDQDVTRNFPGKVNVMIQHAYKKYKK